MADAIAGVKYDPADLTDGNNPLARVHTEGKIAAAEGRMTEEVFQYMLTEGKIAAAMADLAAREAAAARAQKEAYQFNQQGKMKAVIQGAANPGLFLEPPKK